MPRPLSSRRRDVDAALAVLADAGLGARARQQHADLERSALRADDVEGRGAREDRGGAGAGRERAARHCRTLCDWNCVGNLRLMLFLPELWSRPSAVACPISRILRTKMQWTLRRGTIRGSALSTALMAVGGIIVDHDNKSRQHLFGSARGRLCRRRRPDASVGSPSMSDRRLKGSHRAARRRRHPQAAARRTARRSISASWTGISAISSGGCRSGSSRISSARWPRSTSARRSIPCWS